MTHVIEPLELRLAKSHYGLSARRLWEHTELGQINVFSQTISSRPEANEAAAFVDLIQFNGKTFSLTGFTLADLRNGRIPANVALPDEAVQIALNLTVANSSFVRAVAGHLDLCSIRQATRNDHHPFLPCAHADDVFGVPHVFSTLQRRLESLGKSKAATDQWQKTIENFQQKGLRIEELGCSYLLPELAARRDDGRLLTALDLANMCDFKDVRLSIIPVVRDVQRQLRFTGPTARSFTTH